MRIADHDRDELGRLADEYIDQIRRGASPAVEAFAARHPHLADEIRDLFPLLELMETKCGQEKSRPAIGGSIDSASSSPPETLGEFRILAEIGRGGMGVVYEAEQIPLARRVALKLLPGHSGLDGARRERFHREARAAGRLQHPNIVPVLGTGVQAGTEYIVMSYIEGSPLDEVVRELRRLETTSGASNTRPSEESIAAQLAASLWADSPLGSTGESARVSHPSRPAEDSTDVALQVDDTASVVLPMTCSATYFQRVASIGAQIAGALEHAHAEGVVHRDIKPSNVLLDRRAVPWIVDFGLAKVDEADDLTQTGDVAGTLRYLAPERLRGWSDPRTDVYGLGLTLYELLALRPVFDETDRGRLIEQIRFHDPPRPSRFRRHVPSDLEIIVARATAKDPGGRYESAAAMAEDLHRFLEGRPILARRVTLANRALLWARRNRTVAALMAVALGLLALVGVVATIGYVRTSAALVAAEHERDRAERNFQDARRSVDQYLTLISEDVLLTTPAMSPLRRELLTEAIGYYEDFVERRPDDLRTKVELVAAYFRLAHAASQLNWEWIPLYEQAVTLAEEVMAASPDPSDLASWQRGIYHSHWTRIIGTEHRMPEAALPALQRAASLWQQLADSYPDVPGFRCDLAGIHSAIAVVAFFAGNVPAAVREAHRARRLWEDLVQDFPNEAQYRYELSVQLITMGQGYELQQMPRTAEPLLTRAVELLDGLAEEDPESLAVQAALGRACLYLGQCQLALEQSTAATEHLRRAEAIFSPLATSYPSITDFRSHARSARDAVGLLAAADREPDPDELTRELRQALDRKRNEAEPDDEQVADAILRLAKQLRHTDAEESELLYREALEILHLLHGDVHESVGGALVVLGAHLFNRREKHAEGIQCMRRAVAIRAQVAGADDAATANAQRVLAKMLADCPDVELRDPAEAVKLCEAAAATLPEDHYVYQVLGISHYRNGDFQAAVDAMMQSNKVRGARLTTNSFWLAMAHWQLGHYATARQWMSAAESYLLRRPDQVYFYRAMQEEAQALMAESDD